MRIFCFGYVLYLKHFRSKDILVCQAGALGGFTISLLPFSLTEKNKKKPNLRSVGLTDFSLILVICMVIYFARNQYVFFNILHKNDDLFEPTGYCAMSDAQREQKHCKY